MKLLLVLFGLAAAQQQASWLNDFNPESAYLSIISLRRDFDSVNDTVSLNDVDEIPEDNEEMAPPPPPSFPGRPRPGPGPRPDCGAWGPWEQAKCFWPSDSLDTLPASCAAIPTKPDWPVWMKKFAVSKAMEKYSMLMDEYKTRGAPSQCGFCSRSFECRIRNDTATARNFCPMKEVRPLFKTDCDDKMACEVSQERGGCPPPLFLGGGRRERLQGMIRQGNHEGFASELFKMRMMDDVSEGGRQKRQAAFQENGASFMPFEPQFDFPYEGPFESDNGPKSRGAQGKGQGQRRGGEGIRGPGQRGGPGGRRGPGRPERQGAPAENLPDQRGGPRDDLPVQPSFDMPPRFGPRPSHPDFPFFPSNDDQFPAGPMGPRPFGPGPQGRFPPRRQFGPGPQSFGSRPSDGSQQFGRRPRPGPSDGPFGPRPDDVPFNGPMGDGRGPRVERQPQFRRFQPASPRFYFGNQRREMSDVPPMRFGPRRPFGPPPPHHNFLMELFHGTTCASNGKKCLCCCGHFLPNVDTGVCEDLKQLLPGIEKIVDSVDRENQSDSKKMMKKQQFGEF